MHYPTTLPDTPERCDAAIGRWERFADKLKPTDEREIAIVGGYIATLLQHKRDLKAVAEAENVEPLRRTAA